MSQLDFFFHAERGSKVSLDFRVDLFPFYAHFIDLDVLRMSHSRFIPPSSAYTSSHPPITAQFLSVNSSHFKVFKLNLNFLTFQKSKKKEKKWWEKRKNPPTEKKQVQKHWLKEDHPKLLLKKRGLKLMKP